MHLLPRERDKLYLREIGLLAQTRLARGLRLNETETIALLSTVLHLSLIHISEPTRLSLVSRMPSSA